MAVLPADAPEPVVVADFVRELETRLARVNHEPDPAARLRLRVSVHSGLVHFGRLGFPGHGVVEACRLLDAAAFKRTLADSDADLALIVSSAIFRDIVIPGYRGLRAVDFTPVEVTVKEYTGTGYVRLYGGPGTRRPDPGTGHPEVGTARPPTKTTAHTPSERPGGGVVNIRAVSTGRGDAVGGHKIMGDLHER